MAGFIDAVLSSGSSSSTRSDFRPKPFQSGPPRQSYVAEMDMVDEDIAGEEELVPAEGEGDSAPQQGLEEALQAEAA